MTSDPPVPRETSTATMRFRVDAGRELVPGQAGSLKFAGRLRHGLVIRASSVIQSPEGPYVFVVSPDRKQLTRRPIVIGSILYDYAAVISGLRENEYVAAKHTFFLDAEQRLRGTTL
jgi:multidrug efflux pump subunit AcrA (membrane-fusion protein)